MRDGFYIGTFHNDNGVYIDSVKVTGKPEVFEVTNNYVVDEVYRMDDMYIYQHTDFFNPILLDEAPEIWLKSWVTDEGYYWAVFNNSIKWEVIQIIKGARNQFGFKKMGISGGPFELRDIKHLGPLIDLKLRHTVVEVDKT